MTTPTAQPGDVLANLADQLTALSVALYQYRSYNALSAEDERVIRDEGELPLDTLANLLRGMAGAEVANAANEHSAGLKAALQKAKATLADIQRVKDAVAVVADVISLVGAVMSRQPKAVLQALKPFKDRKKKTARQPAAAAAAT